MAEGHFMSNPTVQTDQPDWARLRPWAYLSRVFEGPHPMLMPLIEKYGVEDVVERIKTRRALPDRLLKATESRFHSDCAQADLDDAAARGYRLVVPGDLEWPDEKLQVFAGLEPLTSADAPPTALWVRGANLHSVVGECVALVGTRAASKYGAGVAAHFSEELVARGVSVISGGALGIDAVAHRAAIERGGSTIAVAACGVGVDYPRAHHQLFDAVCNKGALVTEYPPGVRPARHRFLTRNRLVAALSDTTVVIEAGWRSGARNTATWASRLCRPLGAVPGPISSPASTGCHDLIRQEQAVLVTSVENVLALYRTVGSIDEDAQLELDWEKSAVQKLSKNELQVYDALELTRTLPINEVAERAGFTVALTTHLLLTLHKQGLAQRFDGGWQRCDQG